MDKRQPADNNKAYYYHFDGLGSVVALSNSNGDSCQSYEYSVYGQVAASDPNHTNPYMFTGRRFDIETGLYYYRARYYNPHIGRFMQTDPIRYGYAYCGNNPLAYVDPSGLIRYYDSSSDTLAGIIYDSTSDNWWELVGSWTFEDVRSAYITAPGELLSREVDGITVYTEIDLGIAALDLDLNIRPGRGEIVLLRDSDFADIRAEIENEELPAPPPPRPSHPESSYGEHPYLHAALEGACDGAKLWANGATLTLLPNKWINREGLIRRYGFVGRASEVCGGVTTVCLTTAGAMKITGVGTNINIKVGIHPPHHGQGRHFQINWWKKGIKRSGGRWSWPPKK